MEDNKKESALCESVANTPKDEIMRGVLRLETKMESLEKENRELKRYVNEKAFSNFKKTENERDRLKTELSQLREEVKIALGKNHVDCINHLRPLTSPDKETEGCNTCNGTGINKGMLKTGCIDCNGTGKAIKETEGGKDDPVGNFLNNLEKSAKTKETDTKEEITLREDT
jgi:hypothetical protein